MWEQRLEAGMGGPGKGSRGDGGTGRGSRGGWGARQGLEGLGGEAGQGAAAGT